MNKRGHKSLSQEIQVICKCLPLKEMETTSVCFLNTVTFSQNASRRRKEIQWLMVEQAKKMSCCMERVESWWLCFWMMWLKWHCTFTACIVTHNLTLVMRKAPGQPQLKGILQNTHYSLKLSRSSKARKRRSHLIQEKPKEACSITGIYVERQKL